MSTVILDAKVAREGLDNLVTMIPDGGKGNDWISTNQFANIVAEANVIAVALDSILAKADTAELGTSWKEDAERLKAELPTEDYNEWPQGVIALGGKTKGTSPTQSELS